MPFPITVTTALAYSCNDFVAHFAQRFESGELSRALERYGFSATAASGDEQRLQSVGEARVTVTPIDLLHAYAALTQSAPQAIRDGLVGAVDYGTAQGARVTGIKVAGKTGSTRSPAGGPIAWFAGFAPEHDPQVVVCAMTQGYSGGSDAAPLARQMLAKFFSVREVTVKVEKLEMLLEEYVAAVVAGESSVFQSGEALKAMAVAVRTYAAATRGRHAAEGFDFCTTTHCQRMDASAVTPRIVALVAETAGQLLWYESRPTFTTYARDCGGRTEDGSAVWPDLLAPYLSSHDDPYCRRGTWQWQANPADVTLALRASGMHPPTRVTEVRVLERTRSGRARLLDISGVQISASSFRFAVGRELGWNLLRSDRYEVNGLRFAGTGSGHGVGLCQRGANLMGVAGKGYREILAFYYPGTNVNTHAADLAWTRLGGELVSLWTTQPEGDRALVAQADRSAHGWENRTRLPFPQHVEIRIYPDVESFRNATGAPGWMAGFTRGACIHLQHSSAARTLPHELLHALLESHTDESVASWFREGLAGWLEGSAIHEQTGSSDAANARAAAAAARVRVGALVEKYGESTIMTWLQHGSSFAR